MQVMQRLSLENIRLTGAAPTSEGSRAKMLQELPDANQAHSCWVQNPKTPNVGNAGLENKPDFSPEKMKKMGGYRWIAASDPSFLDVERCELLLIGASEDLKGRRPLFPHLPGCL